MRRMHFAGVPFLLAVNGGGAGPPVALSADADACCAIPSHRKLDRVLIASNKTVYGIPC